MRATICSTVVVIADASHQSSAEPHRLSMTLSRQPVTFRIHQKTSGVESGNKGKKSVVIHNRKESPDGPVGRYATCKDCGVYCKTDMYYFHHRTICGDCRYFRRHGREPSHDGIARIKSGCVADPVAQKELRHRGVETYCYSDCKTPVVSERHAEFLEEWLTGCVLSVD